jgi:LPS O-antigen subunit length determinant protein (WzzB/FepE family)
MKYIIIAVALALAGCASTTPMIKVETKEVKVLVTQPYPEIAAIPHPVLEISKIDAATPPGTVAQAYQITVQQLLNLVDQLETQIKGVNDARQTSP